MGTYYYLNDPKNEEGTTTAIYTDLLPAIIKAKEKGMFIEYVGFSHKPSVAMVATCSQSRLLRKEDFNKGSKERKKIKSL